MSASAAASASTGGRTDPEAKRRRTMITPEGLALPVTVASRGARVGALVIDFLIITVSIVAIQILFSLLFVGVLGESLGENLGEGGGAIPASGEFVVILAVLLVFAARYGYFLAFELGPRGATPGKRAVGIRVAARAGGRLTPEAVIARNLIRDIELFMPFIFLLLAPSGAQGNAGLAGLAWFGIFMAFPFFNRDALRAGDVIAGTWVVEAPRTRLAEALSTRGAAAAAGTSELTGVRYDFGEEELSVYGERELQTLERILRENQAEAVSAVHAAICRKIGWDPGAGDERAFLEAFYAQLRAKLESDMRFGKRKADKFS